MLAKPSHGASAQLSDGGDLIDEILFIPKDKLRKPSYAVKTHIFSGSPSSSL